MKDHDKSIPSRLASLYQATDIRQEIAPLIIGERCNPTGSKKFRELLLEGDVDGCLQMGLEQERIGAHVVDLSAAWAGRDEQADMKALVKSFGKTLKAPLMIDSTSPKVIETALEAYPGRPIINSINFEDGGEALDKICRLAKKYGASVTGLTIDEQGMAMDADKKTAIAHRIHDTAVERYGLDSGDLFFDPLTFTIGSGDEKLVDAAIQTLAAIKRIKEELPRCHTVLGLSNISFGLPVNARKVLNAVFLHEAVEAGLDAVIIDPANCFPLDRIDEEGRELALDLIYNRQTGELSPLMAFINYFEDFQIEEDEDTQGDVEPEQLLQQHILHGDQRDLDDILVMLLESYTPLEIVNQLLVPAMREVGELFGNGEMLLPFVLQSAEVMRKSVEILEPRMEKSGHDDTVTVLLATVQGDVHDIGKNLVNIILSNNGYKVIDIGIKVTAETIVETIRENPQIDVLCLSGLLVKSAMIMQESMEIYNKAGLHLPILLGGAALTEKFVARECVPGYGGKVVYCRDAFAGLRAIQAFEAGNLQSSQWQREDSVKSTVQETRVEISLVDDIPVPPFSGTRELAVSSEEFLPLLNRQVLFRGRWGYKKKKMSDDEYEQLLRSQVEPEYDAIVEKIHTDGLLTPRVRYGWFDCRRQDDRLLINHEGREFGFDFPRQKHAPHLSISDYFRNDSKQDLIGMFLITLGEKIGETAHKLYDENRYHDYLLLHGFSVEAAEALAHHVHNKMADDLGIGEFGQRYSFGYSACPDLELQRPLFELLEGEKIGVSLTSSCEMTPEQSVSAVVVHHPEAKYFSV